jgi:CRISPR-associated protein Cmr3
MIEYRFIEPLHADVVVTDKELNDASYLEPTAVSGALRSSVAFAELPILRAAKPAKPIGGLWLNGAGWQAYLNGERLTAAHLLRSPDLWQTDPRLGIALEGGRGTVQTGMLYTAERWRSGARAGMPRRARTITMSGCSSAWTVRIA